MSNTPSENKIDNHKFVFFTRALLAMFLQDRGYETLSRRASFTAYSCAAIQMTNCDVLIDENTTPCRWVQGCPEWMRTPAKKDVANHTLPATLLQTLDTPV